MIRQGGNPVPDAQLVERRCSLGGHLPSLLPTAVSSYTLRVIGPSSANRPKALQEAHAVHPLQLPQPLDPHGPRPRSRL